MRLPIILTIITLTLLSAEPREALLIGNHNYSYIGDLENPSSNLKRLKKSLEDLDFTVKIKTNLNSENLEESIEIFANRLAQNRETIGFLYYTGHGCQVEHQGYLLPTNVDSKKRLKIKHHALNINEMIETLKDAGNRVNMFFLDACRDVPTSTKGSSKGLGQIKNTPKGTLVVYATKAGETAEDNSDFINSIIDSVQEPKQSIRNLPYSISDTFKQGSTSQMPIFSAVDIPKIVLNTKGGYVPSSTPIPKPTPKPQPTKDIVKIGNLMYKNQPFTKTYKWQEAKEYCQNLTLGDYSDWRLPNREELEKLLTKNQIQGQKNKYYIRKEFVQNLRELAWFWTSTIYERDSSNAWGVGFYLGYGNGYDKTSIGYALCVR